MKKLIIVILCTVLISCSTTPTPKGILYTKTRGPVTATSNVSISKSGMASVISILGLFTYGDASINRACEKAGITRIHHADYEDYSVFFGVYQKYTVIVYGE
ncbi:MAG: TRL-like family protein [Spirochaetota bacterium]